MNLVSAYDILHNTIFGYHFQAFIEVLLSSILLCHVIWSSCSNSISALISSPTHLLNTDFTFMRIM